ncbi:hypothetical protein K4B79_11270 [Streptomyces lincolnensis]|uniref:hypothetical protein n=1 Tax=Streptomyces lincolnensis TaxID=1915 RepID=UPI001E3C4B72|nr:hypothetical protein [Streptomyces lincolnensis]MCD7438800.1 hypothetical protein [Streptomyces lincolnensis]
MDAAVHQAEPAVHFARLPPRMFPAGATVPRTRTIAAPGSSGRAVSQIGGRVSSWAGREASRPLWTAR